MKRKLLIIACIWAAGLLSVTGYAQSASATADRLFASGKYDDAAQLYESAATMSSNPQERNRLYDMAKKCNTCKSLRATADRLFSNQDYEGAQSAYKKVLAQNAKDPTANSRLKEITGLLEEAKALAEEEARREAEEQARKEQEEQERMMQLQREEQERQRKKAEEERLKLQEAQRERERVAAQEKAERERVAAQEKAERERVAAQEKAERERVAAQEKAERERMEREKAEKDRQERERAEIARKEKEEQERLALERQRQAASAANVRKSDSYPGYSRQDRKKPFDSSHMVQLGVGFSYDMWRQCVYSVGIPVDLKIGRADQLVNFLVGGYYGKLIGTGKSNAASGPFAGRSMTPVISSTLAKAQAELRLNLSTLFIGGGAEYDINRNPVYEHVLSASSGDSAVRLSGDGIMNDTNLAFKGTLGFNLAPFELGFYVLYNYTPAYKVSEVDKIVRYDYDDRYDAIPALGYNDVNFYEVPNIAEQVSAKMRIGVTVRVYLFSGAGK